MTSVALLHYSCPPVVGGVEEVLRQQAQVLVQHGHDVRIVAGAGGTTEQGDTLGRRGTTVRIHPLLQSGAADSLDPRNDPRGLEEAARRVEAVLDEALDGCDVVFAHNVLSMPFNLPLTVAVRRIAARRAQGAAVPAVVGWNHDSPYFYPDHDPHLSDEPWRILRDPDPRIRWVTISGSRADEFAALYGGFRPEVVPNGIDPHSFLKLEPTMSTLVREERLLQADLVLVQPSRLHPRKNVETSLRVLAALRARGVDARLLITGAHDPHDPRAAGYAARLRAEADRLDVRGAVVLLAGHVLGDGSRLESSQVAIRDLYQVADVLFLPSRSEGFGLPLLEAGLIRLPVACSDIPPLREVGGDSVYRFPLDAAPEDIASGLLAHLDATPTHRMYRRVVRTRTWERIYETHLRPLLAAVTAA
ncbi:MAG TPA: glycosyltransferase family 4 protein [Egibacteraceae bacterium]|mgnify:CR=1 FL=1